MGNALSGSIAIIFIYQIGKKALNQFMFYGIYARYVDDCFVMVKNSQEADKLLRCLMPIDPVNRARVRLSLCRIEKDWYSLADIVETKTGKTRDKARASLAESIAGSAALFKSQPFFLSDEITLADCSAAVLLSRLPSYDIELPKHAKPVQDYIAKMSGRSAFAESLTSPDSV